MKVCVKCRRCNGTGKIVSAELSATLNAISTRGAMTVEEIAKAVNDPNVKITAINNRVSYLFRLGYLVMAGKRGKQKLWQRIRTRPASIHSKP